MRIANRLSNFELLRIVSMFLIVTHHAALHGGYDYSTLTHANFLVISFWAIGGKLGVDCFVMISGYFMVTKKVTYRKPLKLWIEVFIYSALIMAIYYILNPKNINANTTLMYLLPVTHNAYWFVTSFIALYLLMPFINKMLINLTNSEYLLMLFIGLIALSILPTLFNIWYFYSDLLWFIYIYSVAGYLRLFSVGNRRNRNLYLLAFLACYIIIFIIQNTLLKLDFFRVHNVWLSEKNSILIFVAAVCIILFTQNSRPFKKLYINMIADGTFGIYLIHDSNLIRFPLWQDILQINKYGDKVFFPIMLIVASLLVYVVCCAISVGIHSVLTNIIFDRIDSKKLNSNSIDIN